MAKFFVVGHPIAHSLSPQIHAAFAAQFGLEQSYERYLMEPGRFVEDMEQLRREHKPFGVNVTLPFKVDAAAYCDELTERARAANAVNTITFRQGKACGDNTDGIGFVRDVQQRCEVGLHGARVLILGAGGAVRGLLAQLSQCACAQIFVANRTPEKLVDLQRDFSIVPLLFTETDRGGFDLVINATSATLSNAAPAVPQGAFADAQLACDLMYGACPTPFMRLAKEAGCRRVEDGLGMLVEQAAESFLVWNGSRPLVGDIYRQLRQQLADRA